MDSNRTIIGSISIIVRSHYKSESVKLVGIKGKYTD